ncbi:MerR family transcriptional regulator [Lacticaseibacillus zhaodongensis]|uniref:MerR family transcriptional regulator n=1 Tax=Lacticaseibacillus zhaodongensis TaxID=2668065 RepID=UPI0012D31078|nr:MerR family transcriptional regulator [Lacticaseibacillus zhaodongensis]
MADIFSIKDVAQRFGLPISTIRYYDKQGLLPFVARDSAGNRVFTISDLNFIKTICCLKDTAMPLKQIRKYIQLCMAGVSTITTRSKMLEEHKQRVLSKRAEIDRALTEINTKISRYSAPDAAAIISREINFVTSEKHAHNLPTPLARAN